MNLPTPIKGRPAGLPFPFFWWEVSITPPPVDETDLAATFDRIQKLTKDLLDEQLKDDKDD